MLPSETMIWQPEFTDKTLSRKPGAVQAAREEKENAQLLQHEVAALKRINAQEQLRQMEKELVIDREKTL